MSKLNLIIEDIKRVSDKVKIKNLPRHEYLKHSNFDAFDLVELELSFPQLKVKAGLLEGHRVEKRKVQFEEVECFCSECKRPMTSQLDNNGIRLMRRCKQCKETEEYATAGSYFCDGG